MKILRIFQKDAREGVRNMQILMAIAVPIGIGVLWNIVYPDTTARPKVTVAYTVNGSSTLPAIVRQTTHQTVNVIFQREPDAAQVRKSVTDRKADLGLILPRGFDAAVKSGQAPRLQLVVQQGANSSADYAAAALEPVLRVMAGQAPPAIVTREIVAGRSSSLSLVMTRMGARAYLVVLAIIILVGMIALYAVPALVTEESEKGTLDALALIASYRDVIAAKALVGLLYVTIGVTLMLIMTRLMPVNMLLFVAGIALFSISMVGLGLLVGGLFHSMAQLNTWSSFLLLPIILAASLESIGVPSVLQAFIVVMPSSHVLHLAIDGLSGKTYYGDSLISLLVIAAWGIAAYGILWWRLQHREA